MTAVIQAEGLGKRYRHGAIAQRGMLRDALTQAMRSPLSVLRHSSHETFWALNVSLGVVLDVTGKPVRPGVLAATDLGHSASEELRRPMLFRPPHPAKSKIPVVALVAPKRIHAQQRTNHSFHRAPSSGSAHRMTPASRAMSLFPRKYESHKVAFNPGPR
jgi:hypothetical protein